MQLPPIPPKSPLSLDGWRPFAGLWLFERDDDPEHIYRAVPQRRVSAVPVAMASKFFPKVEQTNYRIRIGSEECAVVRIDRLPFQVRAQECTRKQALHLVIGLVEFVMESLKHGHVPIDIHEGNCCWWDGTVFVDLDAFRSIDDQHAALAFVRIAYLLYKYVSEVPLVAHDHMNLIMLSQLEGWMGDVARGRRSGFTERALWENLHKILEQEVLAVRPSHWSDEYACNGGHEGKLAAVSDLVPSANTLLDIGCNKGYVTAMLADRFKDALGIDVDEACVDIAISKYARPRLNFAKVDLSTFARDQPVPIHTRYHADVVLALALTHHLDRAGYPLDYAAGVLTRLAKKWLLVEDIVHVEAYSSRFRAHGFEHVNTVPSFPEGRTLTLWKRVGA